MTPLENKIIPPPMSLHKLSLQSPVNNIIWSQFNMDFLVYLMSGDLIFYKFNSKNNSDKKTDSYELNGQTK